MSVLNPCSHADVTFPRFVFDGCGFSFGVLPRGEVHATIEFHRLANDGDEEEINTGILHVFIACYEVNRTEITSQG